MNKTVIKERKINLNYNTIGKNIFIKLEIIIIMNER